MESNELLIHIKTVVKAEISIMVVVVLSCLILWTPLTIIHQVPLSMGFSRQEYWSGLPLPPPEDIFPTQGSNPNCLCLPPWQVYCLPLHHLGSPSKYWKWKWKSLSCDWLFETAWTTVHGILQARILEWVVFPISRESSPPRDRTQVSCIAGGFFTSWATREAQEYWSG